MVGSSELLRREEEDNKRELRKKRGKDGMKKMRRRKEVCVCVCVRKCYFVHACIFYCHTDVNNVRVNANRKCVSGWKQNTC